MRVLQVRGHNGRSMGEVVYLIGVADEEHEIMVGGPTSAARLEPLM